MMSKSPSKLDNKGFSLVEIIIVMVILTVFATMAARSIKTAIYNKKKIDARLRIEAMVFDALQIMKADVEKAFHYTDPFYELDRSALIAANTKKGTSGGNNNANNNQSGVNPNLQLPPKPIKLTQFLGKNTAMHFTTLNHFRSLADSQESDQVEVGYFIRDCRARGDKKGKSRPCLWRREALTIDDDVEKDGKEVVLLENVKKFTLEYLPEDANEKEWRQEWQSDRNGDAITRNKFPYMVKISVDVEDETKAIVGFKQTVIANVRFPNNQDPAKLFQTNSGNNNGQAPNGQPVPGQPPVQPGVSQ